MEVDPRWYETFFDEDYLRLAVEHGTQDDEATLRQVDFVVEKLELEPPARILDLAGGHGRHAIPLAERGFRVTLFDLSGPSLAVARDRAGQAGVELEIVQGDMRELAYEGEFDAVLNMFTAFGYFEDERDDRRVLDLVARALVPGGAS